MYIGLILYYQQLRNHQAIRVPKWVFFGIKTKTNKKMIYELGHRNRYQRVAQNRLYELIKCFKMTGCEIT